MTNVLALALAIMSVAACLQPDGSATRLTVFAASSLTGAFQEVGEAYEASHQNVDVSFNVAGSSTLRTQLTLGARADVFASANLKQLELTRDKGLVDDYTIFATNGLAVVTPAGESKVNTLEDLLLPGVKVVLAQRDVPVGAYAREMLDRISRFPRFDPGFKRRVLANVVSLETNVNQVVAKIAIGEADAGVVYATNAMGNARSLDLIAIPGEANVVARYPAAVTTASSQPDAARSFVDYLLSDEGQGILRRHGFGPP